MPESSWDTSSGAGEEQGVCSFRSWYHPLEQLRISQISLNFGPWLLIARFVRRLSCFNTISEVAPRYSSH